MFNKRTKTLTAVSGVVMILAVLGTSRILDAQAVSTATVTGRVVDQEGAVLSGAQIKIAGVDTGTIHDVVTNTDGLYTIPNLPIGPYTLQVVSPGFQTYQQTGIQVKSRR